MSIYNLNPALESPPYGDKLEAGELFLDGTDSFISSDGREPVVDVVDYAPAKINVDGSEIDNPVVKWPGQRGANGFFGEYENIGSELDVDGSNVDSSEEGSWLKVLATSSGTSSTAGAAKTVTTVIDNTGYVYCEFKKGTSPTNRIALGALGEIFVTWSTKTFTMAGGGIDVGSEFISDEVFIARFIGDGGSGSQNLFFYVESFSSWTIDEYCYYRNWMVVNLPYPVPYTKGVHPASNLQYDFDWASSDEWTIEGSAYLSQNVNRAILLCTGVNTTDQDVLSIYYNASNNLLVARYNFGGASYSAGIAITDLTWVHFKAIWTQTGLSMTVDGGTPNTDTYSSPTFDTIDKVIQIGGETDLGGPAEGYIQDLRITPTADTSTTHYTSGLPYYDPEKTYGQDGSWSIDKRGNISGIPQQAGVIIADYELDGQRVTKWDTGAMYISCYDTSGTSNPVAIVFAEEFDTVVYGVSVIAESSASRTTTYTTATTTGILLYRWASGGGAAANSFRWHIVGRYK